MVKKSFASFLLIVFAAVILVGCAPRQGPEATATSPSVRKRLILDIIVSEGAIVPAEVTGLAFPINGQVTEVLVEEGETVEVGQVLARLDDTKLQEDVAVAEVLLLKAQAKLAKTLASATPEQITKQEGAVTEAKAQLAEAEAGVKQAEGELAEAEAGVTRSEAVLAQVITGASPEEIAVAQARVDTLQASLNEILAGTRPELVEVSSASVLQAEASLRLAQANYDKVAFAADSLSAQPAAVTLEKATLNYQAAKARHDALVNGATPEEIAVVEARLAEGQAALAETLAGSSPEEIADAQAAVLEAKAILTQAQVGIQEAEAIRAGAQAKIEQVEASLAELLAGATAEEIAIAEAEVKEAEVNLANYRAALADSELKAPWSGTIAEDFLDVGEFIPVGTLAFTLADLSQWQLATRDLTETDILQIVPGQRVTISVDALPNEKFQGTVARIRARSDLNGTEVTYPVVIELDEPGASDPRLRWGMTALIEISLDKL